MHFLVQECESKILSVHETIQLKTVSNKFLNLSIEEQGIFFEKDFYNFPKFTDKTFSEFYYFSNKKKLSEFLDFVVAAIK